MIVAEGWLPEYEDIRPGDLRFESPTSLPFEAPWLGRYTAELPADDEPIVVPSPKI